jgi:hypothetical protein
VPRAGAVKGLVPPNWCQSCAGNLDRFAESGLRGAVFIGPQGGRMQGSNFRKTWSKAWAKVGLPDLHFHG